MDLQGTVQKGKWRWIYTSRPGYICKKSGKQSAIMVFSNSFCKIALICLQLAERGFRISLNISSKWVGRPKSRSTEWQVKYPDLIYPLPQPTKTWDDELFLTNMDLHVDHFCLVVAFDMGPRTRIFCIRIPAAQRSQGIRQGVLESLQYSCCTRNERSTRTSGLNIVNTEWLPFQTLMSQQFSVIN